MSSKYIYNLSSNKLVLFIIFYYGIGAYIFSNYYINFDYINKFLNTFFNTNFNLIFTLPSFILITSYLFKQLNNNNLIIRFKNRKRYLMFMLKTVFKVNSIIYILLLLLTLIMCNITSHLGLDLANFYLLILAIIKMWVWLIIFSFIILSFYLFFKKSKIANLASFILIAILYFSKYLLGIIPYIEFILPNIYLYDTNQVFNTITSNIIARDPGNWYENFTIDKGSNDGIEKNMVVLAFGGLVGKVEEVGPNYAKVSSIINGTYSVSSKTLRTDDEGFVKGDISNKGILKMDYIDKDAEIKEGDEIVTSHLSEIYPAGITVGYVTEVHLESNNKLSKTATIKPAVDFKHLEKVLVIDKGKK